MNISGTNSFLHGTECLFQKFIFNQFGPKLLFSPSCDNVSLGNRGSRPIATLLDQKPAWANVTQSRHIYHINDTSEMESVRQPFLEVSNFTLNQSYSFMRQEEILGALSNSSLSSSLAKISCDGPTNVQIYHLVFEAEKMSLRTRIRSWLVQHYIFLKCFLKMLH